MSDRSSSQVLLTDSRWQKRIASSAPRASFGVEWAAGKGALTDYLTDRWDFTLALELDEKYCRELVGRFRTRNLGVLRADISTYPLPGQDPGYPLVGNLPYHLSGPLLMKLAKESSKLSEFSGLVQWEVANRITANSGDSEFRSLSVIMQWAYETELVAKVPSEAFSPPPDVDSGWIRLTPIDRRGTFDEVKKVAERCFSQPRKTLLNNLARDSEEKDFWSGWMQQHNWDKRRRPHSLDLPEFLEIYDECKTN